MDVILSHFNLDSPLPTFFELYAQERLSPALLSAFRYFFSVLAQRSQRLQPYLPYVDELFLATWGSIDLRFLQLYDATFTENFFGFKRAKVIGTSAPPQVTDEPSALDQVHMRLELGSIGSRERVWGYMSAVFLPYFKHKMESYVKTHQEMSAVDDLQARDAYDRQYPQRKKLREVILALYPYLHAIHESLNLIYYVRYVLGWSGYYSVWLQSHRTAIARLTQQDYVQHQGSKFGTRVKIGLLLLVVGYKLLDWWHNDTTAAAAGNGDDTSAGSGRVVQPPPEIPPTTPLPQDPGACPICHRKVTNAALNAASGYVFCYPCIRQHVTVHGRCPVTNVETIPEHIRRIYENTSV